MKQICRFANIQREAERKANKKEVIQVCIKPDSYIGREITYQTALLHSIKKELEEISKGSKKTPVE